MTVKLITPPAVEPISLALAKQHLRVDHNDDDDLIALYIAACRSHLDAADGRLGVALVAQQWELYLDGFPDNEIRIPFGPLQSIDAILYDDENGDEQTLAPGDYTTDLVSREGWVLVGTGGWPATFDGINAVRIRFTAGYPVVNNAATTPQAIKAAILLAVGNLYANRESVVVGLDNKELKQGVETLLSTFQFHYC